MARKPTPRTEFVLFNVYYEDGTQRSNRRVPAELLGGIDRDEPARAVIAEQKIPAWCRALDARLATNDDPHHFVGTSLTIADLKVLHGLDALTSGFLDGIPTNVLYGYPRLLAWRAAVRAERDARIAAGGA